MIVAAPPAFAQGGATSTIAGTVTDTSGAVVPGADIVVKSVTTGTVYNAVSGSDGSFTIPAVPPGTYSVTVTLMGFKTAVLNDVIANVAQVANVKAVLTLGALEETVVVSGATGITQTQATSVAATLGTKQIASLPVAGRGAFELVGYMPGVATTTGSLRDGTVNGLPQSAVNITLDGMNIQDNYAKSWDGMFTRVSPRLDAVEEVTVSTAAQGADMGSQGAAQVRFVTRSGTNRFQGSAYYYMRRERFNTNTWFNLYRNVDPVTGKPTDKARLYQDQPGARVGGPIWKDKAFFFVNYEWMSSPGTTTANRTIMSPLSEQGKFQYAGGTVDLMALAAKNGHASTIDPVVAKLLADVRSTTGQGTVTTTIDPLTQTFAWAQPTESTTTYPTVRLDYKITTNHRFTGSGTYNHLISDPDTGNGLQAIYPGFPVHGKQDSERFSWQLSMRSTLSPSMVNEIRYGATGGATLCYPDLAAPMYSNSSFGDLGPPSYPSTRVYPMAVPSAASNVRAFDPGITLPYAGTGTIGIQRKMSRNISLEARYIRTDSFGSWTLRNLAGALNYNEVNIVENKFIGEFRVAQANLVANIAAGKSSSGFAYTGAPGTSPLPIFLAHLNGSTAATDASKYTGSGSNNSTLVQSMYALNPNPQTAASNLRSTAACRANSVAAGLPANFFVVNPDVNAATVVTNGPSTKYNGIQLIFNRRYADGFQVQSSYTCGKGFQSDFYAFRKEYVEREQTYSNGSASLGNVRHNLAVTWMYDLPFGRGRKWGSGAGRLVNGLIGDWSIMGLVRWQSGRMVDYGNVRLFGMTKEDVARMHQLRKSTDPNNAYRTLVWMLPEDVIDNTIKAYSISANGYTAGTPEGRYFAPANSSSCLETVAGYGDCGVQSVVVTGPQVFRTDIAVGKRFAIAGPVMGEFQWMIFNPVGGTLASSYVGSVKDNYQVTTAVDQSRTMQLAFRILF
jgi:hypothetical protein